MSQQTRATIAWKRYLLDAFPRNGDLVWDVIFKYELREAEKKVRKACHQDRQVFFDEIVRDLDREGLAGNFKEVFARLAMPGRKSKSAATRKVLSILKTPTGLMAERLNPIPSSKRYGSKGLQKSRLLKVFPLKSCKLGICTVQARSWRFSDVISLPIEKSSVKFVDRLYS